MSLHPPIINVLLSIEMPDAPEVVLTAVFVVKKDAKVTVNGTLIGDLSSGEPAPALADLEARTAALPTSGAPAVVATQPPHVDPVLANLEGRVADLRRIDPVPAADRPMDEFGLPAVPASSGAK